MGREEMALTLQPSEATVAHMASRLYAAYILSGRVTDHNQDELIDEAVRKAMRLAHRTENLVLSDNEPG